ncbi:MAG: hypothetical protein IE886_05510 [Campylobacterales bacterium]|nr:hypothetical protein [Campylobacterales bacterium]
MEQALHEAALLGLEHITLEVRSDSPAAIALCRRYRFETLRTLNAFYGDGCDAYLMQR